jgi:hypothetical protein
MNPNRGMSSWVAPAILGPLASAWVGITLLALVGPTEPLLGSRFWNWVISMALGSLLALLLGSSLLAADVVLARWRALPTGPRAWVMGAGAPWLLALAYQLHSPGQHGNPLAWLLAATLPIGMVAFGLRWAAGLPSKRR